jgi:hypothetical protein
VCLGLQGTLQAPFTAIDQHFAQDFFHLRQVQRLVDCVPTKPEHAQLLADAQAGDPGAAHEWRQLYAADKRVLLEAAAAKLREWAAVSAWTGHCQRSAKWQHHCLYRSAVLRHGHVQLRKNTSTS